MLESDWSQLAASLKLDTPPLAGRVRQLGGLSLSVRGSFSVI